MTDVRTLISSKTRIEILKILALNPESTFNINELSRRTGFSIRGVEKELKNLLAGGILRRNVSGNQHRYQLDLLCPIYQEIKAIITKTVGLAELVKQALISVEKKSNVLSFMGHLHPETTEMRVMSIFLSSPNCQGSNSLNY